MRHLFAALKLGTDTMYGHIKKRKRRGEFLQFCRYLRSLHPPQARIAIVCDNFSPHLTTRKDKRVGQWAASSNAEIAYTPRALDDARRTCTGIAGRDDGRMTGPSRTNRT